MQIWPMLTLTLRPIPTLMPMPTHFSINHKLSTINSINAKAKANAKALSVYRRDTCPLCSIYLSPDWGQVAYAGCDIPSPSKCNLYP